MRCSVSDVDAVTFRGSDARHAGMGDASAESFNNPDIHIASPTSSVETVHVITLRVARSIVHVAPDANSYSVPTRTGDVNVAINFTLWATAWPMFRAFTEKSADPSA